MYFSLTDHEGLLRRAKGHVLDAGNEEGHCRVRGRIRWIFGTFSFLFKSVIRWNIFADMSFGSIASLRSIHFVSLFSISSIFFSFSIGGFEAQAKLHPRLRQCAFHVTFRPAAFRWQDGKGFGFCFFMSYSVKYYFPSYLVFCDVPSQGKTFSLTETFHRLRECRNWGY